MITVWLRFGHRNGHELVVPEITVVAWKCVHFERYPLFSGVPEITAQPVGSNPTVPKITVVAVKGLWRQRSSNNGCFYQSEPIRPSDAVPQITAPIAWCCAAAFPK